MWGVGRNKHNDDMQAESKRQIVGQGRTALTGGLMPKLGKTPQSGAREGWNDSFSLEFLVGDSMFRMSSPSWLMFNNREGMKVQGDGMNKDFCCGLLHAWR